MNIHEGFDRGARCVVLLSPEADRPSALLGGLARRGAQVCLVDHAVNVFGELRHGHTAALVVHQPDAHRQVASLLAAMAVYFPKITCWQYAGGVNGQGKLKPFDPAAQVRGQVRCDKSTLTWVDATAKDGGVDGSGLSSKNIDALPLHEPLVTEDELAMLLGPWPLDEGEGGV